MAETVAFNACLTRCGFNPASVTYLTEQGFTTMAEFEALPASQIEPMLKQLARHVPAGVNFPYLACLRIRGMRAWMDYRIARGQARQAILFTDVNDAGVVTKWTERITDLDALKDAEGEDNVKSPGELKTLGDWPNFQDQMVSDLANHRSSKTGAPLSYIDREHEAVTDEMRNADYDSINLDLYSMTLLTGTQYNLERQRAFDLIKPLFVDRPVGRTLAETSVTKMVTV